MLVCIKTIKHIAMLVPIVFAALFFSCVSSPDGGNIRSKRYLDAETFLAAKRADPSIYWGEGMAPIDGDLGQGKIAARKRALNALSEQISVKVRSDVAMVINKSTSLSGSAYSEEVNKSITQKLETYTSQMLTNLHESRLFIDYPKEGTGTYFIYVLKKEYKDKVRSDLNRKKSLVNAAVKNGDRAFEKGRYMEALSHYIKAKKLQNVFFGAIPVRDDMNGDGILEEIAAYITAKVAHFIGSIELNPLNHTFRYDFDGVPETLPEVSAQYRDQKGERHPVARLPLRAVFVRGSGSMGPVATGTLGEAELPVQWVAPKGKALSFYVEIDMEKIDGLSEFDLPPSASLKIPMERKKAVALAVNVSISGKRYSSKYLKAKIKALFLDKKYSVIPVFFEDDSDLRESSGIKADYIMMIDVRVGGGGAVGAYSNMHTAYCSAVLSLYSLPGRNLILTENIAAVQGFGISGESAGRDGIDNSNQNIIRMAEEMIEKIKSKRVMATSLP